MTDPLPPFMATDPDVYEHFMGRWSAKDLIDPGVLHGLPDWLKVISTIQTILGIVPLFLFGLAIRNRFRMK